VRVVAPFEAGSGVGLVDGAVEHAEHFGGVAAAAEHDEEVRGFVAVAAAVADGFGAGWGEDEARAEEDGGCGEGG